MTSMLLPAPLYYLMSVFNCSVILHLFRKKGIHFVSIDETRPLSEQGPFDIILHKVRKLVFLLRWYCSFGYLLFLTPSILIWWAHFLLVQWPRQTSELIIPFTPVIRFSSGKWESWEERWSTSAGRWPNRCKRVHVELNDRVPTRGTE